MTKLKFLLQFSLILLIFVFPPLFVNFSSDLTMDFTKFNFFAVPNLILAVFLYWQERLQKKSGPKDPKRGEKTLLWKAAAFSGNFFLTFGSLTICAALFELASLALKIPSPGNAILPSNFLEFLCCAFLLCSSAFYEECLYRLYLPKAFGTIAPPQKHAALFWLAEAAAVLLFAFAHRYLGALALFNALICGIILRASFVRSKSLWPPFFAHLSYNAAALLFHALVAG